MIHVKGEQPSERAVVAFLCTVEASLRGTIFVFDQVTWEWTCYKTLEISKQQLSVI